MAKSTTSKTWVASVIRLIAVPSEITAVRIGRPMATIDPKTMSRITIAPIRLISSLEPPSCSLKRTVSIGCPPSSTWRPSPAALFASVITSSRSPTGMSFENLSNESEAKAIVPSSEICCSAWNGETTAVMCGIFAIAARVGSIWPLKSSIEPDSAL